jgi:hypothetical protein
MQRLAVLALAISAALPSAARADPCAPIVAAYEKLAAAPAYRQVITAFGQPPVEAVAVGDRLFMREGGEWDSIELKPGARQEMMASVIGQAGGLKNCVEKPGATVDGAAVKVFSYEPPAMGDLPGGGEQTLWIGAADGLPRRMEAGAVEMVITYDGVTAPKSP